jgi:hypothetical protein
MTFFEKELQSARSRFDAAAEKELPPLKTALSAKKLDPVTKLTEEEWAKRQK